MSALISFMISYRHWIYYDILARNSFTCIGRGVSEGLAKCKLLEREII